MSFIVTGISPVRSNSDSWLLAAPAGAGVLLDGSYRLRKSATQSEEANAGIDIAVTSSSEMKILVSFIR
jgi:hypothetical protein